MADNKPKYDAAGRIGSAIALSSRVPDLFIADKLNGYKGRGFVNAIQAGIR